VNIKSTARQCTNNRDTKARSRNSSSRVCCSCGRAIKCYILCVFVALGIQHAMHMRYITFSSVARLALLYYSKLSHKRHDFWKKHSLT